MPFLVSLRKVLRNIKLDAIEVFINKYIGVTFKAWGRSGSSVFWTDAHLNGFFLWQRNYTSFTLTKQAAEFDT